jgi:hypothetical protein
MPKSGTTSIATMLAPVLRARHEFEMDEAAYVRLLEQAGEMTRADVAAWLIARDQRCNAEVDSTSFLWSWADRLPALFPDARFVATVRHPRDWCRSLAGMLIAMGEVREEHLAWGRASGADDMGSQPLEQPQAFLNAAMGYWRQAAQAIAGLPRDRTWWCRTEDLSTRADDLARWAMVHPDWLRRAPANRATVPADAVREALADEWVDAAVGRGDEETWRELAALADGS